MSLPGTPPPLLVVVPGLGGSVLSTPDGRWTWDAGSLDVGALLQAPHRLSLAESPELVPTGLTDQVAVGPWTMAAGYRPLLRALQRYFGPLKTVVHRRGQAPVADADVLLFPYDFRHGVVHAADRLGVCVASYLAGAATGRRVIVLAHSLGGLVARHWLGPGDGAKSCAALITLGTPHRGAPKALDWLVNGVRVRGNELATATALLREWQTSYDLLPRYRAVLRVPADGLERPPAGEAPVPAPGEEPPSRDGACYPEELDEAVLPGPYRARAADSYTMHRNLQGSWDELFRQGRCPTTVAVFGRDHPTLNRAETDGLGLRVDKWRGPEWLANSEWRGDGTVPGFSAIPPELDRVPLAWLAVPERHRMMTGSREVLDTLRNLTAASMADTLDGGPEPGRARLGIDVEDTVPAGAETQITAELFGHVPSGLLPQGWVELERLGWDPFLKALPLELLEIPEPPRSPVWRATIPALAPGVYRVRVQLTLTGQDPVWSEEDIAVLPL
ncbi:esterase/lipase family protein [Streptomyces virginiae]